MAGAPIGRNVSIYMDAREILGIGDLVVTGTGRCYRVTSNRIQEKGKHAGRQHLRVDVVDREQAMAEADEDTLIIRLAWYSRG